VAIEKVGRMHRLGNSQGIEKPETNITGVLIISDRKTLCESCNTITQKFFVYIRSTIRNLVIFHPKVLCSLLY
jgi:hypothetical protein